MTGTIIEEENRIVHARAAGIDISKKDAKVTIRFQDPGRVKARLETRVFKSTRSSIRKLRDWLTESQVSNVVMESTSVYWIPFFLVLESATFQIVIANAADVKTKKGRKTDVADSIHLALLAAMDAVMGSFIPPVEIRELRLLTRDRRRLTAEIVRHWVGLEKLLEQTGSKLSTLGSKFKSVSALAILAAIRDGETRPDVLADLCRFHVDRAEIIDALDADIRPVHQYLIGQHLDAIKFLTSQQDHLDNLIEVAMTPFQTERDLLATIPGVSPGMATVIIAEIGVDMSQFPTPNHLASWAGLAPGQNESAGKTKHTRCKKGNRYIKGTATMIALILIKHPDTQLGARYHKIKTRSGHRSALVATGRSLMILIHAILTTHQPYNERLHRTPDQPLTPRQRAHKQSLIATLQRELAADDQLQHA